MKIIAAALFLLSFQAHAIDWMDVDFDFNQTEKGKVLDRQTLVVYYHKCQAEKTFEWKDVEAKSPKIKEWMVQAVKDMAEGGKCD